MDFFSVLTMIGGLALFLYGMKVLGDGLATLAGGKMEEILEKMTNSPIKGVLLGAAVTGVIQSSSATTVMVVGFVNSGIMKLSQAVGVIMGANIGTTVTSWILSLTGIESENFFVQLFKPTSFSPVLAMVGVVLVMFLNSGKKKDIGTIMIGFAVLMFGMETMSGAVKPLADVPEFTSILVAFQNPFLGVLAGAVLTAVIQSSSASVGILQAMCVTGSVTVGAAVPVIMGQNIGTCITAILSSVGTSRNAKRAALIHLFFNMIGTVIFMAGFYAIHAVVRFDFLDNIANPATIAIIHSAFNIAATLILLPASKILEKLAYKTLPVLEDEEKTTVNQRLDERFLENPAFAIAQCKSVIADLAQTVSKGIAFVVLSQDKYNDKIREEIIQIEGEADIIEDDVTAYLGKLSTRVMNDKDSKRVGMFSKAIIDFERITDYLKGIVITQKQLQDGGEEFSEEAKYEIKTIFKAVEELVESTVQAFVHDDSKVAETIDPLVNVVKYLKAEIRENHNARLENHSCSVERGVALIDILASLESISRHCSNIAEEQLASDENEFKLHEFAKGLKEDNAEYKKLVANYREKYSLEKAV